MTTHSFFRWLGRSLIPNIGTLVIVALMLAYQQATAQTGATTPSSPPLVTNTFAYQGFLTNSTGQPINGNRALTFRLYDVATGGTALWTEVRNTVAIENGLFDVPLGEIVPIPASVWNTPTLYLGVQVEAESELLPREAIGLVPVAQRAIIADTATQADIALTVPNGSIDSEKLNPTLTFVPAPIDAIQLTPALQPIMTTTVTVDIPSRIWLLPVLDGQVVQGSIIGYVVLDDVIQENHITIGVLGISGVIARGTSSTIQVLDLAPGTHEIVLSALVQDAGPGVAATVFGSNSGLSYMIVSQ